jgi:hypothetical protein
MRVTLFLFILSLILGVALWVTLGGALFFLGMLALLTFVIITIGYADTALLFFLGAREVKGADEVEFHTSAAQEAYKLAVPQPRLYFYNGTLERSFVLQNRKNISLVLSKDLLEICSREELSAISFELLLQVKKGLAQKRTRVMFVIGLSSWLTHSFIAILQKIIPLKEVRLSLNWLMYFMLNPWIEIFYKFTLGEKYFRKVEMLLNDYPLENDLLLRIGSKLRKPQEIYSLSSRKWIELATISKNRHYQNILILEFLPHEWDLIFSPGWESRA